MYINIRDQRPDPDRKIRVKFSYNSYRKPPAGWKWDTLYEAELILKNLDYKYDLWGEDCFISTKRDGCYNWIVKEWKYVDDIDEIDDEIPEKEYGIEVHLCITDYVYAPSEEEALKRYMETGIVNLQCFASDVVSVKSLGECKYD